MTRRIRALHYVWILLAVAVAAAAIYAFAGSRGGPAGESEVSLPPAYYAGVEAAERGDWSAAAVAFEDAFEAAPNAPPLLFALGTAYVEAGRPLTGAVYLSAYREVFPDAPNATKVSRRIEAIGAIYRAAARNMAAEAVAQLDAIIDSETRSDRARSVVGPLIDLGKDADFKSFASRHPKGITGATLAHLLARGIATDAPENAFAVLREAIDAEAQAAASDVRRVGCMQLAAASPVCSELSDSEQIRSCYQAQAGIGVQASAIPGSRAAFAGYLNFRAATHLWLNGAPERLVRLLVQAHQTEMSAVDPNGTAFMPSQCMGWPNGMPQPGASFVSAGSGIEAWTTEGRLDLSKPPPAATPARPAPAFRDWRRVIADKRVDVGRERFELTFDDVVFGDLSDAVRVIGREPAEARAERLLALASKLGLLAQRLPPR